VFVFCEAVSPLFAGPTDQPTALQIDHVYRALMDFWARQKFIELSRRWTRIKFVCAVNYPFPAGPSVWKVERTHLNLRPIKVKSWTNRFLIPYYTLP